MIFIILYICREEIQRIKANNPDISHREAFSTAAKNVRNIHSTNQLLYLIHINLITENYFFIF
jgi:hypothetical protein